MTGLFHLIRVYSIGLLVLLASSTTGWSQEFPFDYWHEGKAVLESGDTIRGKIKYDPQNDIIQVEAGSKFESYTSRKVLFYEIFDTKLNNYRQFVALPYSASGGYRTPVFFELLSEGKITLLSREYLEYRNTNSGFYYYGNVSRLVLVYRYFLLTDKGNVVPVNSKKADFLELMDDHADEVRRYIKSNRLNLERKSDIGRAIAYYNQLVKKYGK